MYYYIMQIYVGVLALIVYVGVARSYKYPKRDYYTDMQMNTTPMGIELQCFVVVFCVIFQVKA